MYSVVYVRLSKGIYTVGVAVEGECVGYMLTEAEYYSVGAPMKGMTLTDEAVATIKEIDQRHRALRRALSLLSYSDKNRRTLLHRLLQLGYSREAAEYAAEECLRLGYIDERRQLSVIIQREVNRSLHGDRSLMAKLVSRGYEPREIEATVNELCSSGEISFYESFKRLSEKLGVHGLEEKRILAKKRGYSQKYVN